MNDDLKFQLRLTLRDEFAEVARNDPAEPSISVLANILRRHHAVMKCQFDAFADYVSEAEANGGRKLPPLRMDQTNDRGSGQEGKIREVVYALCRG